MLRDLTLLLVRAASDPLEARTTSGREFHLSYLRRDGQLLAEVCGVFPWARGVPQVLATINTNSAYPSKSNPLLRQWSQQTVSWWNRQSVLQRIQLVFVNRLDCGLGCRMVDDFGAGIPFFDFDATPIDSHIPRGAIAAAAVSTRDSGNVPKSHAVRYFVFRHTELLRNDSVLLHCGGDWQRIVRPFGLGRGGFRNRSCDANCWNQRDRNRRDLNYTIDPMGHFSLGTRHASNQPSW